MFLFDISSKKAGKYFEYCLQLRPLNAYLNYIYSFYLYKVMKNYNLSYFQLKMAKKLDPNIYILNQPVNKSTMFKLKNKEKMSKYTVYNEFMAILCIKLNKQHRCSFKTCGKVLKTLHACSGCKCVFYCSKLCQKRDWKKHKIQCISTYNKSFDDVEKQTLHNMSLFLNQCITKCVHNVRGA